MNYQKIHTFWGSDEYKNRKAEVVYHGTPHDYFSVRFYQNKQLIEDRKMISKYGDGTETVHSERYAEDAAENWCMGYIT